ncbi:hypothetical protein KIN20_018852 [Parelaphostrongylus tenuis]|nr:hypothetical protein KIN20_018852 [Parelaphostrongylus tenuis]
MCECPATDNDRCGPNSKCANRAILQECPEACEAVGGGCNNRGVSRREVNPAVEIREAPGKGLGAFAIRDIPKGSFIAEYAGELISNEEMNRRIAEITAHRNAEEKHYMMALDGHRIIDCKQKGNEGRFLNHSCSPNCKVETVHVVVSKKTRPNGVYVKYDKRITIYTIEDVPAGSELCFNYQMRQYNVGCPLPDCKCGAPNCTGTLGSTAGSDNISVDVTKQRGNKRSSRSLPPQEPTEKKRKSIVVKREPDPDPEYRSYFSSDTRVLRSARKSILNEQHTVTIKKELNSFKSQERVRDTPPPSRRTSNRRSKPVSGHRLDDEENPSENVVTENLLNRALLKGAALEAIPNSMSFEKLDEGAVVGRLGGSRRTRRTREVSPLFNMVKKEP